MKVIDVVINLQRRESFYHIQVETKKNRYIYLLPIK